MNILMIGDIVGKSGRETVEELLPYLKKKYKIDFVIANGENSAGRSGITPKIAQQFFLAGVDLITTGDHAWSKKEILKIIDEEERILRPANYPPGTPGKGAVVLETVEGNLVGVINLLGRVFLQSLDCPFRAAKREIKKLKKLTSLIIIDMHAEATSEKIALGWYLDGEISAVVGTHTHIQTADERILPQGTAYITDVGMCGAYDSVLGIEKELALKRFLTQMPVQFKTAEENTHLCGVVVEIDAHSGRAQNIVRINEAYLHCKRNNL